MAYINPVSLPAIEPPAMHIPDGFVSAPVAAIGYVVAGVAVAIAVRQTNRNLQEKVVPLMGVMAAFIFAAQMMNFPVAGGTSGHMLGAALATMLLGPWAAMIVIACVVGVQALVFQDGGLAALGPNVLNMAVAAVLVSYVLYWPVATFGNGWRLLHYGAGFAAAWASVQVAALLASFELAVSGTSPLQVALPAMMGVHALIGIGEGLITVAAMAFIAATRRDLLHLPLRKEIPLETS
jgi:cobalt/nickel transport system permease protein